MIIANEDIAPLSRRILHSHVCIVAGKNVFPTTEKLVWTKFPKSVEQYSLPSDVYLKSG